MSDGEQPQYKYNVSVPRIHFFGLNNQYTVLEPIRMGTNVQGFIKTSVPIPEDVLESLVKSFAGLSIQESRPQ